MDIMAIASAGMQGDLARMESISHNVANVLTPGFKRQVSLNTGFAIHLQGATTLVADSAPSLVERSPAVVLDVSSGVMRYSGNPQDVVIEGNSFFEVASAAGTAYTKRGNLRADVQGRLVVGNGQPVMGQGGEIHVNNAPFSVRANGDIEQDGRVLGRLKMIDFAHPESLAPAGDGSYLTGAAQPQEARSPVSLRIGFLEGANVSSPQEMVRLTETVRHFESLQKVVQGYDDLLEKTIRKLGDF
jgi:flagellar basal-body rod protein FlgF